MAYSVELLDITKRFPGVLANDGVTVRFEEGGIHAVIGENGAGKSTLMSILYGLHQPDSGQIIVRGEHVTIPDPSTAISLRLGMVHQHFMLVPSLTVAENVILGNTPTKRGLTDIKVAETRLLELSEQYGMAVRPRARVRDLSVGILQRVEILKALYRGADVLILDEPTAVLTPQESFALFDTLRALSAQGKTIVFISHKLKEVLAVAQQVTVMRAGKVTGELPTAGTTERELARLMVGREVILRIDKADPTPGDVVLELQGVNAVDDRRLPALRDVNLQVKAGTVMGIAGVEGNGQTELIEVITGLRPVTGGRITLSGQDITGRSPRELREAGLAHIPEDRLERGVSTEASIEENLILDTFYRPPLSRRGWLDRKAIRAYANKLIGDYEIATPDAETRAGSLSGGNMQKIVVAREIAGGPPLLIAAQPTRGVDVGAIEYIHRRIVELRDKGSAVLLISAELDEILSLSDEVAVLYEGQIVSVQPRAAVDELELGLRMAGVHGDGHGRPVGDGATGGDGSGGAGTDGGAPTGAAGVLA